MNKDDSYDLFISYAQEDRSWVEGYLLDALKTAGVNVHTEQAFTLGQPRLNEFERAVNRCRRILLVITPAYVMDDNSAFVDLLAQQFGLDSSTWPVIPLYLKPTTNLPTRISMLTGLDAKAPDDWDEVIRRLCTELEYPAPAIPPRPPCPYPGMVPFATADSHRFYGRDREIQEMVERLRLHPFLTVIGASGSGKSSLVFAGLIPALQASGLFGPESGRQGWLIRNMRPGADPGTALAQALDGDPAHAAGLATRHNAARLLLIVDQFEELFTLGSAQADAFQRTLLELIATPQVYVVLAVRADFSGDLIESPLWPQIKAHRLEVTPLGKEQLEAAIIKPAESVQVFVETALVGRLMADAAQEPGVLPLLQETLRLLWEKVERRYLAVDAYTDMAEGGRNGLQIAIDRRANVVYNNLPAEDQPLARRIFLRLIQFGEGRADTRRQLAEDDLRARDDDPTRFANTLQTLIDHRLLTASGGEGETARRVDIAHEALISGWTMLRGWIDDRRTAEQTRRRLETTAQRWEELDRAGGLLDPVELAEAQRWLAQPDSDEVGGASVSLAELIEASAARILADEEAKVAAQKREVAHAVEQAQARRRTFLLAAALLTAVFVVVAVGWFWQQSRISEAGAVAARSTAEIAAITEANARGTAEVAVIAEADARSTAEAEAAAAATNEAEARKQKAAWFKWIRKGKKAPLQLNEENT
ncbi:MAG: toll/interleukin-1 receptor domain-containing protein [Caldilineaceae bacterium]|nr:toll/interleukin-1 receptor domain-containing protein [Caldilineaceae bacterium]MBP8108356.1 toll/interleukin-1 receptor domain-containing protein [Caldilineaceae bacterium]MBP8122546.1 toll/interleukin-1 receptor domain-containing protein [Caldilineaceae bacterium]MBP9072999.1 toll/interleukin-1 receptor domain-containing protein [Caldilineaceae bacterium]